MRNFTCSACGAVFVKPASQRIGGNHFCSIACYWDWRRGRPLKNSGAAIGLKYCPTCQQMKPVNAFGINRTTRDGLYGQCKVCRNARSKRERAKAKALGKKWVSSDYQRNKELVRRFGITLAEYNALLMQQEGKCAICGKPESEMHANGKTRSLAVDHDHETDRVRGLLCRRCNTAIGILGDTHETIRRALSYLEQGIAKQEGA